MKTLIVGAGIAGLAIGWRLAQAGSSVEIFDRGLAGRGATWASAGMLAPGAELGPEPSPLATLAHNSRNAWPEFARELQSESGTELGFRQDGTLMIAWNEVSALPLNKRAALLLAHGMDAAWLNPTDVLKRENMLASDITGALFVGGDAQVDNRALTDAFRVVLRKRAVVLRENCAVEKIVTEDGRAVGIATGQGDFRGDKIVLATGAWLNRIEGVSAPFLPEVKPIKGQMAAVLPPAGARLPRALIWDDDVYLVPRRDRLLIGATVEDVGFDTGVTREARDRLIGAASRLIPGLTGWTISELWAGLRPKSPDEAPILGETTVPGLYVAGGQYRNGILFAPLVADTMCALLLGKGAPPSAAFDPKRFPKV
ncbi:MAG TPA: glycine oxidase ThiO [Micropepsaceae bacterium]|nr:glycine oxidase ThiO [Micropepsaceae bacterium]